MAWRMPAETAPHDRTWMAFPRPNATLGDGASAEEAYDAWTAVAHAVAEFEPVTIVVDPVERDRARRMLGSHVEQVEAPLDDYWMRDIGPTFVLDDERPGVLGAVDWIFNGWGGQDWARWAADGRIAASVADLAGSERIPSLLVNEGGAIHVDGEGTVLLTETVQLDPGRNPSADRVRVEAELLRTIGASTAIWLPRGLTADYGRFGTRGHVDMVAASPSPGRVLLHEQHDSAHPDAAVSAQLRAVLEASTDAAGRTLEVVSLPAPATLRLDGEWVDWSYVNHLAVNGGVIACGFGEPEADARAAAILADAYPGRRIVTVDARAILARGGGIHCITQQQPSVPR